MLIASAIWWMGFLALADDGIQPCGLPLRLGMDSTAAQTALGKAGATLHLHRREEPQALRLGLIDTGLLQTLNHFGVRPDLSGVLLLMTTELKDRHFTLAFLAGDKLGFVLARIPVPVDPSADPASGWSPARLHRLWDVLEELSPCRPVAAEKDATGNVFAWRGNCPRGGNLLVWYLPDEDEVRCLLLR